MNKLVNYSSSSSEDENEVIQPVRKKVKLPIPFEPCKKNQVDDPTDHDGRKRQIPHIAGNWSCHVFIDCSYFKDVLSDYINRITEKYEDIKIIDTPHVSLSKNFIIKYHWIENLSKVIGQNLKFSAFKLKFSVSEIVFLSNEEKSRHFACILVDKSCKDHLEPLIESTDKSLKEFELPMYYENRIFHASIFWKLTEFAEDEKTFIREEIHSFVQNENILFSLVKDITFKTGNKIKLFNCQ
ncbi:hypothetical protein ACKWTF_008226 [Chironomus riparius]